MKRFTAKTFAVLALGLGFFVATPALLNAQFEGEERGVAPVNSSGDFQSGIVIVEVDGANAFDARSDGWRLGQRKGWSKLWAKTHGGAGSSLPDGRLDGIVSSIEVIEEEIGPNHYRAKLNIYFDRARAGQILGVRGIATRSAPMLVIPVTVSGGSEIVFEQITEWQKAWARFRTADSSIDYVRPSGSGAESLIVNAGQLGRRNREWWRVILDQFGAADVIMPVVRLERKYPGGPVIGHFAARSGPDNRLLDSFTLRVTSEKDVPEMLDQGVARMDRVYADALAAGLLRPDQTLIVEQIVEEGELQELAPTPVKRPPSSDVSGSSASGGSSSTSSGSAAAIDSNSGSSNNSSGGNNNGGGPENLLPKDLIAPSQPPSPAPRPAPANPQAGSGGGAPKQP